jgi:glycine/D-amino acid oxidase-like deaminating enzyme/nitrite reductase/ring-hydroxylating ferredoxin subunit
MIIRSPWIETAPAPERAPLSGDLEVDVCVVGAGVAGLTTALLLAERGASVAVAEMDRVGSGTTGYTTAKVTVLHGTIYSRLVSAYGAEEARQYAAAQQAGLDLLAGWVRDRGIECDMREAAAYTYAPDQDGLQTVLEEVRAAREAGVEAESVAESDLPFPIAGAVRVPAQYEFHPRRYCLALADAIEAAGGKLLERTRALDVEEGETLRVLTDRGTITAKDVVVASHYPFLDRGLYFPRLSAERSYALGVRIRGALPRGMYLSTESPAHSVRSFAAGGEELLLVGGESHKTGQGGPTGERYVRLEAWARDHWDVDEVVYRWAAQDTMPIDHIPFVGRLKPGSPNVWVATGFQKWGFTNGSAAGLAIADAIDGRTSTWAQFLEPKRLTLRQGARKLVKENVNVGAHFVGDRFRPRPALDELAPGEGGIVTVDGRRVAAFRHEDGRVDAVDPACTHLGCQVSFNDAERTWDCPCHGSRFRTTGEVVEGPAVRDLEPVDVPQQAGAAPVTSSQPAAEGRRAK